MRRLVQSRGTAYTVAAFILTALLLTAVALFLRSEPESYSVGDGAVLEIYTIHAANGALTVGPYSRFGWNHPGPSYFYLLAPAYLLADYREDALLATVLVFNLAVMMAMLAVAAKYGGWPFACALMIWLAAFYLRPGTLAGWDFADLLSSSWNPHAPLLPFALLLVLAAVIAAGYIGVLPMAALVASFISQTHVAFLPMSVLIVGSALFLWFAQHRAFTPDDIRTGPVTNWVRVLDTIGLLYGGLVIWVVAAGGFDLKFGSVEISVNSVDKLLVYAAILTATRYALSRNHPLLHRMATRVWHAPMAPDGIPGRLRTRLAARQPWPPRTRRTLLITAGVLAIAWSLPIIGELTGDQPGNLVRMSRSMGADQSANAAVGVAAFAYELAGVVTPDFPVAAGGRVLRADAATWLAGAVAAAQLIALVVTMLVAVGARRTFLAAQAFVCLVASAAALWAAIRVGNELHDHLAFWISMLGVVNVATITAAIIQWVRGTTAPVPPVLRPLVVIFAILFVAGVGTSGASHIRDGHHRQRFSAERQRVATLAAAVRASVAVSGQQERVRVNIGQEAWPIAAGLILDLYKRGVEVTVVADWVSLCGPPMQPSGRETIELLVADDATRMSLPFETPYQLIASDGDTYVYRRPL